MFAKNVQGNIALGQALIFNIIFRTMSNVNIEERLRLIESSIIPVKRVMSLSEIAEFTGVSESQIYKLTAAKKIPFSRPFGRAMYFDRLEVEEWLLSFRIQTEKDTQREANSQILKRRRA